ncbi:MAG: nucleotide exchange factor GrpE [Bacteroidales bacterium]
MTKKKNLKEEDNVKESTLESSENKDFIPEGEQVTGGTESNGQVPGEPVKEGEAKGSSSADTAQPAKETAKGPTAEEKLAEMQDRYLRLSAEFDNYRKRTLREKIELTKHAGEEILKSIVPVLDDFERAMKSMEGATDCTAMKGGIDLIYNKFRDILKQNGLKEIESINQDFNVDLHEAISKLPVQDEALKGKVVDVVQKGYYLHEKVMRFSKVVVGE